MKVVDNSLSFQSILNHLNWTSVAQDIPKTLRGAQTRIKDTVRAGDPCALIFTHTVRAKGPVHIQIRAHGPCRPEGDPCWLFFTLKTIESALVVFMKVVDNCLIFLYYFESS